MRMHTFILLALLSLSFLGCSARHSIPTTDAPSMEPVGTPPGVTSGAQRPAAAYSAPPLIAPEPTLDMGPDPTPPTKTYSVGGSVDGLYGQLSLTNEGSDPLLITDDGHFRFVIDLPNAHDYSVRIAAQPVAQHCRVSRSAGQIAGHSIQNVAVTCVDAACINEGWKSGGADWSCPRGFRLPRGDEYTVVAPCLDPEDQSRFSAYADIAISVGGCGCAWNSLWCDEPSIETMRQSRACGDYEQLHVCVVE